MKLFVVKVADAAPPVWGSLNEAVVRAKNADQARQLLLASWGAGTWRIEDIQVAELTADGPPGIVSGTELS